MIHGLGDAVAALGAARRHGVPLLLLSAPGAARAAGAAWWREVIAQARAAVPGADATAVLDCAGEPGMALAAIREGVEAIALDAGGDTRARIADIARQAGVALVSPDRDDALDLAATDDPQAACEKLFASAPDGVANGRALG
ncbi:MAG: hypothetical protein JJ899_15400 [Alphaproteobacteria bacterium]|nr:hypothetical protein [Alphaproteobacteria bacterium]